MIKNFTPRLYQETIFATAVKGNTLVVLPTGLGKTTNFLMLAAHRLKNYPSSKILFLGPTRPLIEQYLSVFKTHFDIEEDKLAVFTGFVNPQKRAELWKKSKIIFSTPQGLENDIVSGKIDLKEVSLLGFDEAHRAVKNYSYVWIANQYQKRAENPRILALTASPGSDMETIKEVCKNLFIEEIELRTQEDPDVKQYVQEIEIDKIKVELPNEFKEVRRFLEDCFKDKLEQVKKYGYLFGPVSSYNKTSLLNLQASLHAKIVQGEKDFSILKSISHLAEAIKTQHALELLETQNTTTLKEFLDKLQQEAVRGKGKAVQNLVKDLNFRSACIKTEHLIERGIEHPKLTELKRIISEEVKRKNNVKIIVFSQYRDTGSLIVRELEKLGISSKLFIGQAKKKDTGLSQKNQKQMLEEFKIGLFNVLVSSSVGEEGLDIPAVDLVIFYEPVPSAIRKIQRIGRTGRFEKGRVVVLITKATMDEAYFWVASRKETKMYKNIHLLRTEFAKKTEPTLSRFIRPEIEVKIFADYREKGSNVLRELIDLGAKIELQKLDIGDYILSDRVAVEYKKVSDFLNSIIDGRLLKQLKELRKYEKPVIIIEGDEDIFSQRNIHPNAIRGMLATIAVDYGIPILHAKNFKETSALLLAIAKREQDPTKKEFTLHFSKPLTLKEQQEYIIGALPGVGGALSKPLLKKFGSVKKIMIASEEDLMSVEQIGEKKAKGIREVVDSDYFDEKL